MSELNITNKHIKKFIKYFETKHKLLDFITQKFYEINNDNEKYIISASVSSSEMFNVFIKTLLTYYSDHEISLNYSSNNISDKSKIELVQSLLQFDLSESKTLQFYNLFDFIFLTLYKVLKYSNDGFSKIKIKVPFSDTIYPRIDILTFAIFFQVFPKDLNSLLVNNLHISKLLGDIISTCHVIIRDNKICNVGDKTKGETFDLKTENGILMLLKILNDLRAFEIHNDTYK